MVMEVRKPGQNLSCFGVGVLVMGGCPRFPLRSGLGGSSEIRPPSLESTFSRLSGSFMQRKIGEAYRFALLNQGCVSHCAPLELARGRGQVWAKTSGDGGSWRRARKG